MMRKERKKLNSIHIVPDLVEEIFLRLPLKSILKFKTVSKQWRSILESKMFTERRMSLQKSHRKILAAYNCDCPDRPRLLPESRFEGDEEIVFLHSNEAQRASMMTCDGLLCFPEPNWVTVLNPSTRQLRRFRSGPDPVSSKGTESGNCVMGFGRDKVTGNYKVVRMCFDPVEEERCHVLDVECGEWRKLSPPPYKVNVGRRPLDRLAIVNMKKGPERRLEIWSMDAEEEIWSNTYCISLAGLTINPWESTWFTVMTISKFGNVVFCDNHKRLFKYRPETNEIRCLSSDICVISPYLENLVPLGSKSGYHSDLEIMTSRCGLLPRHLGASSGISKLLKGITFGTLDIVFITLVGCMYKKLLNG